MPADHLGFIDEGAAKQCDPVRGIRCPRINERIDSVLRRAHP
jgi:hypothetical protein